MLKFLYLVLGVCLNVSFLFAQTTYYVSASQGNDSNSGTVQTRPFKTLQKIESLALKPGDKVLLKRDDIWYENLSLSNIHGTQSQKIIFSAYGSGVKPVLNGREVINSGWMSLDNHIWSHPPISTSTKNMMWLEGKLIKRTGGNSECYDGGGRPATTANMMDSISVLKSLGWNYRFQAYGNSTIFLYSNSNPDKVYNMIEVEGSKWMITLTDCDYLDISNIQIEKSNQGIRIAGSPDVIIDSIQIAYVTTNSIYITKNGNKKSENVEIKNCNIDVGIENAENGTYQYYWGRGNMGIKVENGADNGLIHNNVIKVHQAAIFFIADNDLVSDNTVNNWRVYDNTLDFTGLNWGRAFSTFGSETSCTNNKFYRNIIIDQSIGSSFGGYRNAYYFNVWKSDKIKGYYGWGEIVPFYQSTSGTIDNDVSKGTLVFNNTFYDLDGILTRPGGLNDKIFNNLIVKYDQKPELQTHNPKYTDLIYYNYRLDSFKNNYIYDSSVTASTPIIRISDKDYSITSLNTQSFSGGNFVLKSDPFIGNPNSKNWEVDATCQGKGLKIDEYLSPGFVDLEGNIVNQLSPNIGALDNSSISPTGFRVYLQGPFYNGLMKTELNNEKLIPLSQPYNISPWNYSGNESVSSIPSDIVDWILVELRSSASPSSIVSRQAAFLRNDGSVAGLDGVSPLTFGSDLTGSYYIVVKHRNHLSVISSQPVKLVNSSIQYDFTTSQNKAYGDSSLVDLGNGVYGMIGGDVDANGTINDTDVIDVSQNLFSNGYNQEDADMNSPVNVLDYKLPNNNKSKTTNVK